MDQKVHSIIFNWLEKHYLIKYYLIFLFLFSQCLLLSFFHDNLWLFYGYLFSCFLSLPFYTSIFLLLEYDWFKAQPFIQNMTSEELYQRYKCNPKFVKRKNESLIINILKNDRQYYNDTGKKLNDIVIWYFSHTSIFILVGINLNIWLVTYIIITYCLSYKIKKKERRRQLRKGNKVAN